MAGGMLVQLRYATDLTSAEYVSRQAWRDATLKECPLHPQGGCGFHRQGTYERLNPPGARIARWYCREGHETFSLLPDCLAARFSGTLADFEAAVEVAEQAPTREAAASELRPHIEPPGAVRWLDRRRRTVAHLLVVVKGLLPDRFELCAPTLSDFRRVLGVEQVLLALRSIVAPWLDDLSPPLGFRTPLSGGGRVKNDFQHSPGPDPPAAPA